MKFLLEAEQTIKGNNRYVYHPDYIFENCIMARTKGYPKMQAWLLENAKNI